MLACDSPASAVPTYLATLGRFVSLRTILRNRSCSDDDGRNHPTPRRATCCFYVITGCHNCW